LPVIFQLDIREADIKSNADIFYIQEHTKDQNAHNVLFLRTRDPFRVLWGDRTFVTNKLIVDEDIEQIKNLLNRNAIVIASLEGYTEDLRKTSPQTAHYLDLRLEELYEIYKPKTVVR
jgi:hypothetical protein|tara:strand:- start:978 stop:1331 length:354 start_codon:yes stop_codon:yes gene_type:complete